MIFFFLLPYIFSSILSVHCEVGHQQSWLRCMEKDLCTLSAKLFTSVLAAVLLQFVFIHQIHHTHNTNSVHSLNSMCVYIGFSPKFPIRCMEKSAMERIPLFTQWPDSTGCRSNQITAFILVFGLFLIFFSLWHTAPICRRTKLWRTICELRTVRMHSTTMPNARNVRRILHDLRVDDISMFVRDYEREEIT